MESVGDRCMLLRVQAAQVRRLWRASVGPVRLLLQLRHGPGYAWSGAARGERASERFC